MRKFMVAIGEKAPNLKLGKWVQGMETDKYLRRLEALMAVGDKSNSYIISGTGDVLEPEGDVIGIGSGGNYALAAGKVLMEGDMPAEEVAKKAIKVAADICVFTNDKIGRASCRERV